MITCQFENGGKDFLRHVVVDTIILRNNKILLVKRTKEIPEGGKWGLVGGYVKRDEVIKQAVERETFEETGWRVKNITFLHVKDDPDRPNEDTQNVAFVFFCTAVKREGKMDWESDAMAWFELNHLPSKNEIAFDHIEDIDLYKKYLKEKIQLQNYNL